MYGLIGVAGALIFLLGLGSTGVVDETPALFAASARGMVEGGDWLIPHVNGLPRYDKPPLVYWLMGAFYALPGQAWWNPLGTWAARLPSALASMAVMLMLSQTLLRWPQSDAGVGGAAMPADRFGFLRGQRPTRRDGIAALNAALVYALGPLAWIWGRTEVSDALFSGLLACALLLAWRRYAGGQGRWWSCWLVTALAVLTKGPVALVLLLLTLALFGGMQRDGARLVERLHPWRGSLLTLALVAPWYGLALLREGEPFWNSFFVYHNLERFTQVVNNHHQAWWYFGVVLLVASLPWTPLLLLELFRQARQWRTALPAERSLARFATCWLLVVLLFFSLSATKLPSYWLPATPAAALLVALPLSGPSLRGRGQRRGVAIALGAATFLLLVIVIALAHSSLWLAWIDEPTMPGLQAALGNAPWPARGGWVVAASALLLAGVLTRSPALRLLQAQLAWLLLVPLVLLPLLQLGDQLRERPIRELAALALRQRQPGAVIAMVGLNKPSLHYYTRRTILFEGRSSSALINLAERLAQERRPGLDPCPLPCHPRVLMIIDSVTAGKAHWRGLSGEEIGRAGPYRLLLLERRWLERRARQLESRGHRSTWREPRMERF